MMPWRLLNIGLYAFGRLPGGRLASPSPSYLLLYLFLHILDP